jgi:hypothetical protein
MNPDENLMYTTPLNAWAEGAQQGNIQMPKVCLRGVDFWSCPETVARGGVCKHCGMTAIDQHRKDAPKSKTEQAILGAQVANILTAAERGEDMVNLPPHYARFKIEPMHFIVENGLNWFQGNVLKYILRYDAKNGLEDLRKAQRYLTMFIKWVEGDVDWWKREDALKKEVA